MMQKLLYLIISDITVSLVFFRKKDFLFNQQTVRFVSLWKFINAHS
jgi:hypothetical protein